MVTRDERMTCNKWFFEGFKVKVALRQGLEDLRFDVYKGSVSDSRSGSTSSVIRDKVSNMGERFPAYIT